MIMKLIIGNKNYSSWSMRPWLLLKHFGIDFEEIRVPLETNQFTTTVAEYSGAGRVPVLKDGELVVWDSLAICEYLSEQYLQGRGWPADAAARAQARSACAEMHSGFFEIREHMPMNCRARRAIQFTDVMNEEIHRVEQLWHSLRQQYAKEGPWLCGSFSIVDCMYAPMASRFHSYRPALSAHSLSYVDTVINHPAVKNWYQQATAETEILDSEEVGTDLPA